MDSFYNRQYPRELRNGCCTTARGEEHDLWQSKCQKKKERDERRKQGERPTTGSSHSSSSQPSAYTEQGDILAQLLERVQPPLPTPGVQPSAALSYEDTEWDRQGVASFEC